MENKKKKIHWKEASGSNYIGAYCVETDLKVKIKSVQVEEVKGPSGRADQCIVAQLENQKPFIINKTNAKTISEITGSPFLEDWSNKEIVLYATTTKLKGEVVECLRVREPKPILDQKNPSFENIKKAIKSGAYKIEQIEKKYEISETVKKELLK